MFDFKQQTLILWSGSQMGAQKCPFREWADDKRKLWLFHAMHSLPYFSRVCFSLNFVQTLLNTAQVVFNTARIAFIFTSLSTVQIYDFHIFTVIYKQLMTGFKGCSEFSFAKTLKCSLNWSQREQLGSNKKWLLSWEV